MNANIMKTQTFYKMRYDSSYFDRKIRILHYEFYNNLRKCLKILNVTKCVKEKFKFVKWAFS